MNQSKVKHSEKKAEQEVPQGAAEESPAVAEAIPSGLRGAAAGKETPINQLTGTPMSQEMIAGLERVRGEIAAMSLSELHVALTERSGTEFSRRLLLAVNDIPYAPALQEAESIGTGLKRIPARVAVYWEEEGGFTFRLSTPEGRRKDLAVYDNLAGNALMMLTVPNAAEFE